MAGGRWVGAALVLLLVPSMASAWTQLHGDAGRAGLLDHQGPLDIVGQLDPYPEDYDPIFPYHEQGPGFALDDEGLAGVVRLRNDTGFVCAFVGIQGFNATPQVETTVLDQCVEGQLMALDAPTGRYVLCNGGGAQAPILQVRDRRDHAIVWSLSPAELATAATGPGVWSCKGAAVDHDRRVVVASFQSSSGATPVVPSMANNARHLITWADLDTGQVRWTTQVPIDTFTGQGAVLPVPDEVGAGFEPQIVSLTQGGLVVTGRLGCASAFGCTGEGAAKFGVAWIDELGTVQGGAVALGDAEQDGAETSRVSAGSSFAVARGGSAALAVGTDLYLVDPASPRPVEVAPLRIAERVTSTVTYPGPAWVGGTLLVPLQRSLVAYDAATLEDRWAWRGTGANVVQDLVATEDGRVHLLVRHNLMANGTPEPEHRLLTLDLGDGRVIADRVLPDPESFVAFLVPGPDGRLLVVQQEGPATVLGTSSPDRRPRLSLDDMTPEIGTPVTLTLEPPRQGNAKTYAVAWGDGALAETGGASLSHTYTEAGTYTLRVTALHDDGTTATATKTVEPGGQAPDLNLLQRAFARENQDLTFGILGLVVALGGGGIALYRRRKRLSKLEQELAALDEISEQAPEDPAGAARALEERRAHIQGELSKGRLDDGQYAVLQLRLDRMVRLQRDRLLSPFEGSLTPSFQRFLDAALEDGFISSREAERLSQQAREEPGLDPAQREELLGILEIWTREASAR